jgi:hypothetical protein
LFSGLREGLFYLKPQVVDSEKLLSNLKFFISNAFSCGAPPPNENALGLRG